MMNIFFDIFLFALLQLKSCESGNLSNHNDDGLLSSTEILSKGSETGGKVNHSGANGSVITMTMKNNHLIVETEERNVSMLISDECGRGEASYD